MEFQPKTLGRLLTAVCCLSWSIGASLVLPGLCGQVDLSAAIAGLQRRYASVDSIQADFRQTYRGPGVDQTESGALVMKKPGLMRWEYRDPEVKLFVADGRDTYLYTPEDRQVLVSRFTADDLRSTPLQFLLGQGDIRGSFKVGWEPDPAVRADGGILLRLTPRSAGTDYAYVIIECDGRSFDLRRIVIQERTGNTSEFVFNNVRTNVKVDSKQFRFKIPKGVEVIRVDEK
jgi:outer membrane lipoprotein carrier protein